MIPRKIQWYILNEQNLPVEATLLDSAIWMLENRERRIVARSEVDGGYLLTHFISGNYDCTDPPTLYESMFIAHPYTKFRKYATRDEALSGHEEMLKEYHETLRSKTATE
jgi:hypothetical protein